MDYFKIFRIPEVLWVTSATMHFDDPASKWLQVYKLQQELGNWKEFVAAVETKFGSYDYRRALTDLMQLKQQTTVEDYHHDFDQIRYQLEMHNTQLGELFFVAQFVNGLKDEIKVAVYTQAPVSVDQALYLASLQQEMLNKSKFSRSRPSAVTRPIFSSKKEDKQYQPPDDLWKARQVKNYRRANGLCIHCGEKFEAGHLERCTKRPRPQVYQLTAEDLNMTISDELLAQLDSQDDESATLCHISMNAVAGTDNEDTIRLRALVQNKVMLTLVDSGSSHCFISAAFLETLGITPVPLPPAKVKVANGSTITCSAYVPKMEWWIQGYTFHTDMRVLDLGAYDAILGIDWLKSRSPMNCHWLNKTMEWEEQGQPIKLTGVLPKRQDALPELPADQLFKWCKGNDIWACAIVQIEPPPPVAPTCPEVKALLDQYQDVFHKPNQLPPKRIYDHHIPLLPNAIPVNSRPYRYSPFHKTEIEKQVQELLDAGLIVHSMSPFASPVLLVQKKDGTWRFCVDYRKLNSLTIKDRFPMPIIDEILDELAGTQYFTTLDMSAGYHQVRMRPEDEFKTAFKTHHGHYQFKVMPFGLCNAPATFQYLMNSILQPYLRKFVMVFLDDILIYSPTLESHLQHLKSVLDTLRQHQFYLKASKCTFAQQQPQYLGHIISKEGVATDPKKTEAMCQWPSPSNVTELRGFLGLTGYYRKFVKHYGIIARPLTHLLKKKQFSWSEEAQVAFEKLKVAMVNTPVLALPNFSEPFTLETDACDSGVGAVLMQNNRPIAFFSKSLAASHQHLSIYEK